MHRNKFLYNNTIHMHQFPKFTPAWNSAGFGQFFCRSSGVYSLYTRPWYMPYRFLDRFRAGPGWNRSKAVFRPVWHIPVPSVQWINCWWWAEELPETCRVSCRSKFGKLVHMFGLIIKILVLRVCGYFWEMWSCYGATECYYITLFTAYSLSQPWLNKAENISSVKNGWYLP